MKRVSNLYPLITDPGNIRQAIRNASKGKRDQPRVKRVFQDQYRYSEALSIRLRTKEYEPSPPRLKTLRDGTSGKIRTINQPAFYPDQVVHWALMQQIQPILMRGMYAHSCGSIPGRGTSHGQKVLRKWLDKDPRTTKYCLKLDIKQFYPSIDVNILKAQFRRKIKDQLTLELIDAIIGHGPGLPIGNYTSQWFSNFYLEGLDHYIKQTLGAKYYVRYVDDLVILGPNKRTLHKMRIAIDDFLRDELNLEMKRDWQVFRVDHRDIDFLGMRFFRDKTILRKSTSLRLRRRLKKIRAKSSLSRKDAAAILSYWGWMKRTDSYGFYQQHVKPYDLVNKSRRVMKDASLNDKPRTTRTRRGADPSREVNADEGGHRTEGGGPADS